MPSTFKDFIPAGEDTGAQGDGFKDFVKPATPVAHTEKPVVEEPEVKEASVKKKKGK